MSATTTSAEVRARVGDPGLAGVGDGAWRRVPETELALVPTPLDRQPSAYVRSAWAGREHGRVSSVRVAAAVLGGDLLVRIRWNAAQPHSTVSDVNAFADACAVLFPLKGDRADISTMGSAAHPVCGWYWRAGAADAHVFTAGGLGTVEREKQHGLHASSEWAAGEWRVLFRRALNGTNPALQPGDGLRFAVAAWSGAGEERAGLKAHTPQWHRLLVDHGEAQR